jgi:hypothetical protein
VLAVIGALSLALVACVAEPEGSSAPEADTSQVAPAPGRTIAATPPSVGTLAGYRIAVVVPDDSSASLALLEAARDFAESTGAELSEFPADASGDDPVGAALAEAVEADADVVVGLGEGTVPVFDFETGKILEQQVLVVGGQLAEPTENVTAVIWPGATSRDPGDDASVTVGRGTDALGAGITSIRDGVSGVVLDLG